MTTMDCRMFGPKSPTAPMRPVFPSRALVSIQIERTINSRAKRLTRQTTREASPPIENSFGEPTVGSRTGLEPLVMKGEQKTDAQPECQRASAQRFEAGYYFLRRLLITNSPPERRARALTPELASISGTAVALAVIAMPANSNIIPAIFIYFLLVVRGSALFLIPLPGDPVQVHYKRESGWQQSYGHKKLITSVRGLRANDLGIFPNQVDF